MTIEIKQLIIKSSVNGGDGESHPSAESKIDLEEFKKDLLAECKQIISESLSSVRER